jgi:hypothetical protein
MAAYIINKEVNDKELQLINENSQGALAIQRWPTPDALTPSDIEIAILIVREASTPKEETRAIAIINAGFRIVCIHLDELKTVSELAKKYCSAQVSISGGALGDAIKGNDQVQEKHDGQPAPRNKQKPHNC